MWQQSRISAVESKEKVPDSFNGRPLMVMQVRRWVVDRRIRRLRGNVAPRDVDKRLEAGGAAGPTNRDNEMDIKLNLVVFELCHDVARLDCIKVERCTR